MARPVHVLFLLVAATLFVAFGGEVLYAQTSSSQGTANDVRAACAQDVQKLCANVPSGGGRIFACLKQHQDQVSDGCKQAVAKAMGQANGGAGMPPATPSAPASAPSSTNPPSSGTAPGGPKNSQPPTATSTKSSSSQHYFLMKQVKIIDQGSGQGKPAFDLLIPTDWQFKSAVNVNVADGGCYGDWFSVLGDARSADNSVEFQVIPQFTFQYADSPAVQSDMQKQNQLRARVGQKPCPVRAPMQAGEFLRQVLLAKYRKGKTIVSVEEFPELDQVARYRFGMPRSGPGGDAKATIYTNAARARLSYTNDKGQPVEEWVAGVVVVRKIPLGTSGAGYDWHAMMLMSILTPQGKLDGNEKLFKLIGSTIRPEPEWLKWSSGVIGDLYEKQKQESAAQSEIVRQLQQYAIGTIYGVVDNQQRGSMQSANGMSQLIREVQTFRDPTTGRTFELSNKYDNAWHDPNSQYYVMSDDSNFNPNGKLDGNWTQLELVRPQP